MFGVNLWVIGGIIATFVALGSAVWLQTVRLSAARAEVATLVKKNESLTKGLAAERNARKAADEAAKKAIDEADEARRSADKLRRENDDLKAKDIDPARSELYRKLQCTLDQLRRGESVDPAKCP